MPAARTELPENRGGCVVSSLLIRKQKKKADENPPFRGAGDENRTHNHSLGSCCFATKLHLRIGDENLPFPRCRFVRGKTTAARACLRLAPNSQPQLACCFATKLHLRIGDENLPFSRCRFVRGKRWRQERACGPHRTHNHSLPVVLPLNYTCELVMRICLSRVAALFGEKRQRQERACGPHRTHNHSLLVVLPRNKVCKTRSFSACVPYYSTLRRKSK